MARIPYRNGVLGSLVFLLLIAIVTTLAVPGEVRAAPPDLSLHMLGEAPQFDGTTPVLVAGIWHEIDVNLTAAPSQNVTLQTFLPGGSPIGPANTYRWEYNPVSGTWTDPLYNAFIRTDLSSESGPLVVFVVGVDADATVGIWTLTASVGGSTVASETIEVQAAQVSYGLSTPDFTFRVDPFANAQVSSQPANVYLRTINQGNVPLGMSLSFDTLQSAFSVVNPSNVAHLGSDARYFLALSLGPLPPQVITVTARTNVTPLYVVPSAGASRIVAAVQQLFAITVEVGHSGYAIQTIGNVVFQTLATVKATYASLTTWQVYLTGAQNVTLDVSASGVRLKGVFSGSNALAFPAPLPLAPTAELPLTVQIEVPNAGAGSITFTIHLVGTGDTEVFTTQVVVIGGPGTSGAATATVLWIAGAALAAGVFGLISFNTVRHRKKLRNVTLEKSVKKGYHARRQERAGNRNRGHRKGGNGNERSKGAGPGQRGRAPAKGTRP
jgi:hypothetical protein